MTPADRVKAAFLAAIGKDSEEGRRAAVDAACAGDPALRAEVESLLAHHGRLGRFLEGTGPESPTTGEDGGQPPTAARAGTAIGPYRLVRVLGEGGMGVVWLAEQEQPIRREVALKLIKPGVGGNAALARFMAERQALALMEHPNIARVLDAGTAEDGRPYFVMDLVDGRPITRFCDERALTVRDRLALFLSVCQAVQHAHTKGVIHRDIKPSNVLVALADGVPAPKVIDFGIAKATGPALAEQSMATEVGTIIGTLEYMSPEQARFDTPDIDTRSDIYSLGVLLYELITGTTPLTRREVLSRMEGKEVEPARPSLRLMRSDEAAEWAARRGTSATELASALRDDLDWIALKALARRPDERYETAAALAADIRRYLNGEPVEARPPSSWYRLGKFVRRNRVALGLSSAFLLALVASVTFGIWQTLRGEWDMRRRQAEARGRALEALTREVALGLDGNLRALELAALALGSLPQGACWRRNEAGVAAWARAMLAKEDRIFGMAVALEKEDYCLYVCRKPGHPGELQTIHLHAPGSGYDYRKMDWFNQPKKDRVPRWSPEIEEFDAGGPAKVPVIAFVVPLLSPAAGGGDEFIGVVTVDVSIEQFFKSRRLAGWMGGLGVGRGGLRSYGFIISHSPRHSERQKGPGAFISHPAPGAEYRYPQTIGALAADDPELATLARQMLGGGSGSGEARDPRTGRRSRFYFAPVPSAEWTFVAVIPEDDLSDRAE